MNLMRLHPIRPWFILCCILPIRIWNILSTLLTVSNSRYKDALWRWQECSYVLNGINPFNIINRNQPPLASIGELPPFVGNVPWEFCLGNVFLPAVLPFQQALFVMMTELVILTLITAVFVARFICKLNLNLPRFMSIPIAFSLLTASSGYYTSLYWGNTGAMVSMLILAVFFLREKYPICSGVLLSLAMCKPQTAILFFFLLFMEGRWKTLLTATGITLIAWGITIVKTNTAPFEMLHQMGEITQHYKAYQHLGLLKIAHIVTNLDTFPLQTLNSALWLFILTAVLFYIHRQKLQKDSLLNWSIFSIISLMWAYHQPHDFVLLAIPLLYTLKIRQLSITCTCFLGTILLKDYMLQCLLLSKDYLLSTFSTDLIFRISASAFGCLQILCYLFFLFLLIKTSKKNKLLSISLQQASQIDSRI